MNMIRKICGIVFVIPLLFILYTCEVVVSADSQELDQLNRAKDSLTFITIKGDNTTDTNIIYDLNLVRSLKYDVSVKWKTSDTEVIDRYGTLTPPVGEDIVVYLTAFLTKNRLTDVKVITVTVPQ